MISTEWVAFSGEDENEDEYDEEKEERLRA
jgi:hypothetical protein